MRIIPSMSRNNGLNEKEVRESLGQILNDSKLYKSGKKFQELLDFVVRMPYFAPFNAMLLQIQSPGLRLAASSRKWIDDFKRTIKPCARPLVILWPMGPVDLVYDFLDTEGADLPNEAYAFYAAGQIDLDLLEEARAFLERKNIFLRSADHGSAKSGLIRILSKDQILNKNGSVDYVKTIYEILINDNQSAQVKFASLVHELARLYLGHLGQDKLLGVSFRSEAINSIRNEIEAEAVAYLVCKRHGISPNSGSYLSDYVGDKYDYKLDIYRIMRAAGQVESILKIGSHQEWSVMHGPHAKANSVGFSIVTGRIPIWSSNEFCREGSKMFHSKFDVSYKDIAP